MGDELVTKPPGDRYYIGGANVAGILGCSPYRTPLDEYLTIVGEAPAPDEKKQKFFDRRKALEPFVVSEFQKETGLKVARTNVRYEDFGYSFLRAEIDFEPDVSGTTGEIKTVHPLAARDWGPSGSEDPPVYVTAQAMHGLMVTGRNTAYIVGMIGFDDLRIYRVERDAETIKAIRDHELAFWQNVVARRPPQPSTPADVLRLYGYSKDEKSVEALGELAENVLALRGLSEQKDEIEEQIEARKAAIELAMLDATVLTLAGTPVATWRWQESRRIDTAALKQQHPTIAEEVTKITRSRVFRLK